MEKQEVRDLVAFRHENTLRLVLGGALTRAIARQLLRVERGNVVAAKHPRSCRNLQHFEVLIRRSGGGVLLLPREITYERVMAAVSQFKGKFERHQPKDQKRTWR